ncbi:MAG TPA: NAD(P)-dependent oxidoreductase [Gemmatimonadales bacterium]|jgi:nucleoside-diphosphate-sugar epimerase|nr:NAD(P)-dependent oxidoreductase [Gemmatimonadales bacterium]
MILVTGGAGYIGSVLVRQLLSAGHRVRVVDNLMVGGDALLELVADPSLDFVRGDLRDGATVARAVAGCRAVAHLAAIVGDPACRAQPDLARETNLEASRRLYQAAEQAGCTRFVFASTCSNYGRSADPGVFMDEQSPLAPVSLYAETKVAVERHLLEQPRSNRCKPVCLRFATVYGFSPRMRFDLTVNEFAKDAALGRSIQIFGEQFWRPYCHVSDLARSVVAVLQAREELVAFEVFNVGDTGENYTKRMIAEELIRRLPDTRVDYVHRAEDPRDYRVNFGKIAGRLEFGITRRVPDGIEEVVRVVQSGVLDPDSRRYANS